ncbi:MAG: tRNA (N6-threonylcarbamoyladenosine(37)-N6)-methyltransferase TrmO [Halorhodospira sp.]
MADMQPIGVIRTPYVERREAPRQPSAEADETGRIEVEPALSDGLRDLDGFSHITLVFLLDRSDGYELEATPPIDDRAHGVFATRSPRRPNPVGISTVRLERIEGNVLHIRGPDMLDGTPLLDIKPYNPDLAPAGPFRCGWIDEVKGRSPRTERDGHPGGGV